MILITILFIILFIYVLIIDYKKFKILNLDHYSNAIDYININDSLVILKNNDYFDKFYKLDYISRNINNISDYYLMIDKSVSQFTVHEKDKINKCIYAANNILKNISFEWFDGNKCLNIPWKIICVDGKLYENGLPHTRNEYIIISRQDVNSYTEDKLMKTLIHEKVHVYQKLYKEDSEKYIIKHNFIKYKYRDENDKIRANPDINNWIYKDKNNNIYCAKYITNNPTSIENIKYEPYNSQSFEHPFEKMAIEIEQL